MPSLESIVREIDDNERMVREANAAYREACWERDQKAETLKSKLIDIGGIEFLKIDTAKIRKQLNRKIRR